MKEKRLRFAGVELSISLDERRVEKITSSAWWRYLAQSARPFLGIADHPRRTAAPTITRPPAPRRPTTDMDEETAELWAQVSKLAWYHAIDLGKGVVTPGFVDRRGLVDLHGLPRDLSGKRALDVATADGFWAFEMERRGAAEVVGIDVDSPEDWDLPRSLRHKLLGQHYAAVGPQPMADAFQLAKSALGSKVSRVGLSVYDLSPQKVGMFDVVFVSDLLIHMRDPQTALENIFSVTKKLAIIAEFFDPALDRYPNSLSEFWGTSRYYVWWMYSSKALKKMMETAGFDPVEEVSRFPLDFGGSPLAKVVFTGTVPA